QQGKVSYEAISRHICLYVYDFPRRTKRWDQDRCSDFFVFVHHRLRKMADSFVYSGLPFEAYLNTSLKHQMISFIKKKREKELKEELFCRMCASGTLEDESSFYKIYDTFNYEIKEPAAAYKNKTGQGRTKRRLFFLALSDPDRLDDESIAQISASTGYSADYINRCCMAVKEKVQQKRDELRRLKEKKSGCFFQILVIQEKIMYESDIEKRLWLEERVQRLRGRIERLSRKIAAKASCLVTHQDLAQVLGVSKGTVDSSIFYLKRKRNNHTVSSSSADRQSLHSLQR
ncbi:MAG: hypothetical protein J6W33_00290, partial [Spirochaetia bacterium]|nr:hypothetical protein [Spirochaetia bacterium]